MLASLNVLSGFNRCPSGPSSLTVWGLMFFCLDQASIRRLSFVLRFARISTTLLWHMRRRLSEGLTCLLLVLEGGRYTYRTILRRHFDRNYGLIFPRSRRVKSLDLLLWLVSSFHPSPLLFFFGGWQNGFLATAEEEIEGRTPHTQDFPQNSVCYSFHYFRFSHFSCVFFLFFITFSLGWRGEVCFPLAALPWLGAVPGAWAQ